MAPKRSMSPNPTSSGLQKGEAGSGEEKRGSFQIPMRKALTEPIAGSALYETMVMQHFDIDLYTGALKGPKKHEKNTARTIHDIYNLVALVPICVFNGLCWKWDKVPGLFTGQETFVSLWTGNFFGPFFFTTLAYFLVDVIWVIVVPKCVASPSIIIGHHLATLLYLLLPYQYPQYGWFMGACLSVEVNTWFLIARRVFNRDGRQVFSVQAQTPGGPLNVKVISLCFYITWIVIRLMIYPALYFIICAEYGSVVQKTGTHFNILMAAPCLQAVFCFLNLMWSRDLLMSKLRSKKSKKDKGGL